MNERASLLGHVTWKISYMSAVQAYARSPYRLSRVLRRHVIGRWMKIGLHAATFAAVEEYACILDL